MFHKLGRIASATILIILQIPISISALSANSSGLNLVVECCNKAKNSSIPSGNCVETDDVENQTYKCLPYKCEGKTIFAPRRTSKLIDNASTSAQHGLILTFVKCTSPERFDTKKPSKHIEQVDIFRNGTLNSGHVHDWSADSYCIDVSHSKSQKSKIARILDDSSKTIYICMDTSDADGQTLVIIYMIMTTFAASFLLITLCCFLMTYEKQSIHGWTQCTHVLAFFLLMVCWNVDDAFIMAGNTATVACKVVAIGSHFFYISLFSWLFVVNFDLRHAFQHIGQKEFRPKYSAMTKYLMYSAFGWGVPLAVVLITVMFSLEFDSKDEEDALKYLSPLYGFKGCSLTYDSYWLFMILPIGILLILILILFVKMVRILQRQRRSSRRNETTALGVKILFLMGPFWFFELLTLIHLAFTKDEFVWYILVMDTIVIFQAIPLFVIYICRPDTLLYLQQKYPRLKGIFVGIGKLFCVRMANTTDVASHSIEMNESFSSKLRVNRKSVVFVAPRHGPGSGIVPLSTIT